MNSLVATSGRPMPADDIRPSKNAGLTVEVRRDVNVDAADAAVIEEVIGGRPHVAVFMSRAWLSGLFAEPPAGAAPALVLFRQDGVLRALVPIALRSSLTHVHVSLLGGGLGSDRTDLVARRGYETLASDGFLNWLRDAFGRQGFVLELRDVPTDSALWGAVHRAGAEGRLRLALEPRDVHALPYLDLTEPASLVLPWNSRSLSKHRRWLERRGRLRIERLDDAAEILRAFTSLKEFLHARWSGQPSGSALDQPRAVRFHQRVLPALQKEGRLRMIRISCDARTIAVFYGLAQAGWRGYYLAGYDREWAGRLHLGQLTLAIGLELAVRERATEFDFLKGADRVKYFWPVRERTTLDADIYSAGCGAQLSRAARASRDAVVALARSAHALLS